MTINSDKATGIFDWFDKKTANSKATLLLILIIAFLSWSYYTNEKDKEIRIAQLEKEIELCKEKDNEIAILNRTLEDARMTTILVQASSDYAPYAQWLTDARTGNILWVNQAYINKYLKPNGFKASDLIGTNGEKVFGKNNVDSFVKNNEYVFKLNRPMTFKEIEWTTKYPVKVGNYVFAIGGTELERFE